MPDWAAISEQLGITPATPQPVSGGDISAAWRLGDTFVKVRPASDLEMFAAEADGLNEIASSQTLRVPAVVGVGVVGTVAFLGLEWLPLGSSTRDVDILLGERLAAMHRATQPQFGWYRDNTIGATPQTNTLSDGWADFFREHRLEPQLRMARDAGYGGSLQTKGARLLRELPEIFSATTVVPSLLHGDLWGGNWGAVAGDPVLFDPAVYYGHRETDIAMTQLFGGFGRDFYAAYTASWPLDEGYHRRAAVYQLYHVLNHLNLFGQSYLRRAVELLDSVA